MTIENALTDQEEARRMSCEKLGIDYVWLRKVLARQASATVPGQRPDLGDLTDAEYRLLRRIIPAGVLGARGESPRTFLDTMLFRVRHGRSNWRGLPSRLMSGDACRQKHSRWKLGTYEVVFGGVRDSALGPDRKAEFALLEEFVRQDRAASAERRGR